MSWFGDGVVRSELVGFTETGSPESGRVFKIYQSEYAHVLPPPVSDRPTRKHLEILPLRGLNRGVLRTPRPPECTLTVTITPVTIFRKWNWCPGVLVGGVGQRRGAPPRLVQTQCWYPRDVGCVMCTWLAFFQFSSVLSVVIVESGKRLPCPFPS